MAKLESLSQEQEELMLIVANETIDLALKSGKQLKVDEIKEDIAWLYKISKLEDSKPNIVICESPMATQLAINVMMNNKFWEEVNQALKLAKKLSQKKFLGNSVWNSVENSVWNSVWNSVAWNSVWNSVENSVAYGTA
jgi:hypothetical protein